MSKLLTIWTMGLLMTVPAPSIAGGLPDLAKKGCSLALIALVDPVSLILEPFKRARPPVFLDEASIPDQVVVDKNSHLTLSKAQYIALHKARAAGDHNVQMASVKIDGKDRLVIILGETHVKSEEAAQLANNVVKEFPVRGLEGADISKTWGGKYLGKALDVLFFVDRWNPLKRNHKSSTIDDASKMSRTEVLIRSAAAIDGLVKAGTLREEDLGKIQVRAGKDTIQGSELLEALELFRLASTDPEAAKAKGRKFLAAEPDPLKSTFARTIPLEQGHVPDLRENIASVFYPSLITACGGAFCLAILDVAGVPGVGSISEAVSKPALAAVAATLIGAKIATKIPARSPWHFILNPTSGIGRARSKTMARNLQKALKEDQAIEKILVLVGKAHVPEIMEFLEEGRPLDLPTPQTIVNSNE